MSGATAEEEAAVLDRFLTRLALTEEDKLEKVLSKLLPVAIKNLASPHETTKKKVLEMLSHINKRVKDQKHIKLPLQDLLALYRDPGSVMMVRNFAIVYIEMAFERSPRDEQLAVVPGILEGIADRPGQHQDIFFRMVAKGIEEYGSNRGIMDDKFAEKYPFRKNDRDRALFLEFALQLLLFQPPGKTEDGQPTAPPGLSLKQAGRVAGKEALAGETLGVLKLAMLNFLGALDLSPAAIYPHLLVASVDSHSKVSRRGDELVKKRAAGADLEDAALMRKLFSIFQGTSVQNVPAELRVAPASPTLKARLMLVFTRSIAAANCFPATLQCVFDCVYGEHTTMRLKQAGMEFAVWIFKHASPAQLAPMAPVILKGLTKLLAEGGADQGDAQVKQLRAFTYQALGQLAHREPKLFRGDVTVAAQFFQALKEEGPTVRPTVQEALSTLATAYQGCAPAVAEQIESLLLENVEAADDGARFCAVQWATKLFPFGHASSRYVCMLGAGDHKLEVREVAESGLKPPKGDDSLLEYPPLASIMALIAKRRPRLVQPVLEGEKTLLLEPKAYIAALKFVRACRKAGNSASSPDPLPSGPSPAELYRLVLEHALARDGTAELHETATNGLLEVASTNSGEFAIAYAPRLGLLRQHLGHTSVTVRESVAKLIGIVVSALGPDRVKGLLSELTDQFEPGTKGRFEDTHGAIAAAGYIVAQCVTGVPDVSSLVGDVTKRLGKALLLPTAGLAAAAAEAVGHIGLRGPLLLPDDPPETGEAGKETPETGKAKSEDADVAVTRGVVLKRLVGLLSDKDMKTVQASVLALGHLCHGDRSAGLAETALKGLFTLLGSKHEDTLFAVGEALAFIWGGVPVTVDQILKTDFVSLVASSNFLAGDTEAGEVAMTEAGGAPEEELARTSIVQQLFDEALFSSRKDVRCGGCVALVSLVSYCGRQARIQSMLPDIQDAFSHLLGDPHELTQEMASRGLSIVYELGDAATKETLVQALVGTLSGTAKRKRAVKVTGESEVFQEGALGEAPGGGGMSTYKELCSIANEMGQPDLIYRFMDLARHQAGLASRKGAAFGFAGIAKKAGAALAPHTAALVPKLYRMQYDPSPGMRDAMGHIWRALVAEPKKATEEHFGAIMDDLLTQLGSRMWRSREAAALALSDLLQGRRWEEVGSYLERCWSMGFRALDDIKETVRTAATTLCRTLTSLSARLCDPALTPEADAKAAVAIVLPFLLTTGVPSSVTEVRRLSLATVTKLVKQATPAVVRPHVPDLVFHMLEGLSSLEDSRLNYVQLHAERMNGRAAEQLESARVAAARDSPMWATLELCLRQVDAETMEALSPKLVQLIRSGVGLTTRAGVARFITMLTTRTSPEIVRPHAAALLKALFSVVRTEKSAAVRKACAAAAAGVAKPAAPARFSKFVTDTCQLYDAPGDVESRTASGLLLRELSRQANEQLKGMYTEVLPLAFVGKYDDEKEVRALFGEVWEENTSSVSTSLQLYLQEIMARILPGLASSSWSTKQQCAKASAALAEGIKGDLGPNGSTLLVALLGELPGRLWDGKEAVLHAIGGICKACSETIVSGGGKEITPEKIVAAVVAAGGRKKGSFREAAFECLEKVLQAFQKEDLFAHVATLLLDVASSAPPAPKSNYDVSEGGASKENEDEAGPAPPLAPALGCLAAAWEGAAPATVQARGPEVEATLVTALSSDRPWTVRVAALNAARTFVKKAAGGSGVEGEGQLKALIGKVLENTEDLKYSQVRSNALDCLADLLTVNDHGSALSRDVSSQVRTRLESMALEDKNATLRAQALRTIELFDHVPNKEDTHDRPVPMQSD